LRKLEKYIIGLRGLITNERFIETLYVIILVLSASGFTYVVVNSSPPLSPGGTAIAIGTDQTSIEFLLVLFGYLIGLIGLYIIYRARRYLHNPRFMLFIMMGGMLLSALSFLLLNTLYSIKGLR